MSGTSINRQRREVDFLLDSVFIDYSVQGGWSRTADAHQIAALATARAIVGIEPGVATDQAICHEELVRTIRSGASLPEAVRIARLTEPAKSAFDRLCKRDSELAAIGGPAA